MSSQAMEAEIPELWFGSTRGMLGCSGPKK